MNALVWRHFIMLLLVPLWAWWIIQIVRGIHNKDPFRIIKWSLIITVSNLISLVVYLMLQ